MTKTEIQKQLYITDNDLKNNIAIVVEKLFCAALLSEDTRATARVLNRYNELKVSILSLESCGSNIC